MVANGKRLRVNDFPDEEEINDFFGKRSEDFCQKLLEIGEWTNAFLRNERRKGLDDEKKVDKGSRGIDNIQTHP